MIQRTVLEAKLKEFLGMADDFLILTRLIQDDKLKNSFILMKYGI